MDKKRVGLRKYFPICMIGTCVIDSFFLDPFLLFSIGLTLVRINLTIMRKNGKSCLSYLAVLTLGLFWFVSISLYLNANWTDWIARICGAQNGRDWMINSGIFHFNFESPSELTHLISGFLFATYPLWLWLGIQVGYVLFGRKSTHRGVISLFSFERNK